MAHYATGTFTWNGTNITGVWYTDAARTVQATVVPTSADDVIFDALTGTVTCSATEGSCVCNNYSNSGGVMNSGRVNVYGNINVTKVYGAYKTAAITTLWMNGSGKTITVADFAGVAITTVTGASVTLASNLACYALCRATGTTGGTVDLVGYTVRTYQGFGISTVAMAGTTPAIYTNEGAQAVSCTISPTSTLSSANITHNAHADLTISSSVNNMTLIGSVTDSNRKSVKIAATINGNLTAITSGATTIIVNQNCTITGNVTIVSATNARVYFRSDTYGTSRTLTVNGTNSIANCCFRDIAGAGSASWNFTGATDVGDGGNNSGISFARGNTKTFLATDNANWNDASKWVQRRLKFDGVNDYIQLPLLTYINNTQNQWTIEFLVNLTNLTSVNVFISNGLGYQAGFYVLIDNYIINVNIGNSSTDTVFFTYNVPSTSFKFRLTYNGTKAATGANLYINDVLVTKSSVVSNLTSNTITQNSAFTFLGKRNTQLPLYGSMNSIRIWSSVVDPLTTTIPPDLLDMPLDDGGSTTVVDRSPSANHGTMYNFTTPGCWSTYASSDIPLPQDTESYDSSSMSAAGKTITFDAIGAIHGKIVNNGLANLPTLVFNSNQYFISDIDISGFGGLLNQNIISYVYPAQNINIKSNSSIDFINIYYLAKVDVVMTLLSDINVSTSINHERGVIDLNGFNLSVGLLKSVLTNGGYYKKIYIRNGILKLTGTGTVWQVIRSESDLYTIIPSTGKIEITDITTADKYIDIRVNILAISASVIVGNIHFSGAGTLAFYGSRVKSPYLFTLTIGLLRMAAGTTVKFLDSNVLNQLTVIDNVACESTLSNNCVATSNGNYSNISITNANMLLSKVLDFGYCNMSNVVCSTINTVYAKGIQSNCTNVYNQTPYLTSIKTFGGYLRYQVSTIAGYAFNSIKNILNY